MSLAHRVLRQLQTDPTWSAALDAVARCSVAVYVVGGTVRDALLGRPSDDLDLAVDGNAGDLGKRLADALGGSFFVMDREHDVARVLLHDAGGVRHIDLARLRAEGIAADLSARDFSVNAIALSVSTGPVRLLDPVGGLQDLARERLRMAAPRSFVDDPVRVLRLVRMRSLLGFEVEPITEQAAIASAALLQGVTAERTRDELLGILALDDCAQAWRYAHVLGLWQALVETPIDAARFTQVLLTLDLVSGWQVSVSGGEGLEVVGSLAQSLRVWWQEALSAERERWLLTRLALAVRAMLSQHAAQQQFVAWLRLSRREVGLVGGIMASCACLLASTPQTDMALHRYFRAFGEAGVDGAVCALAESMSFGDAGPATSAAQSALEAWFERHEQVVAPPRLVSGDALMRRLGIASGPQVGELLTAIREAQVVGLVRNADEACALAARLIVADDDASVAAKEDGGDRG